MGYLNVGYNCTQENLLKSVAKSIAGIKEGRTSLGKEIRRRQEEIKRFKDMNRIYSQKVVEFIEEEIRLIYTEVKGE